MNELIKRYEGYSEKAYKCPAGIWTIGHGNTTWEDGTPVKKGDTITKEKAEALLNNYLIKNVRPKIADLKLTTYQNEALESLIYNIGWSAFAKSKCYKAIKAKDWGTAFNNWDWISAGGKALNGLIKRRAEEIAMFFTEI